MLMVTDTFKTKTQEMGKSYPDFKTETFFPDEMRVSLSPKSTSDDDLVARASPRLVSDQMVNIFFQEWAPLFPILHRSTFLKLYERYITDPEGIEDHQSIAQLNLVFGIAALSAEVKALKTDSTSTWLTGCLVDETRRPGV